MASTTHMSEDKTISPRDKAQWFTDLGLGRGVDATKANPWAEKSSFQVQSISKSLDNIMTTDEGGTHNYYEREISSISSRQAELKLSVEEPNTSIHVGMDTLYSNSVSKSQTSVGEQVINRTISFVNDFDALPLLCIDDKVLERRIRYLRIKPDLTLAQPDETASTVIKTDVVNSFEEKLSEWLLDRIRGRKDNTSTSERGDHTAIEIDSSATRLANYLKINTGQQHFQEVVGDCRLFLEATGVTHYVHSIQLGAMKFRVLKSSENKRKVGIKGNLGAKSVAKSSLGFTTAFRRKSSSMSVKEIGKMTNGAVNRGTGDEAVIGFKLMPIQRLVRSYQVNKALKRALRDYIVERAIKSKGPFLISCGNEKMRLHLKVDDNGKVIATPDVELASIFFLNSADNEDYPDEFMISYNGEDENALMRPKGILDPMSQEEPLAPLPLYLNGPVSLCGRNHGPLEVKSNIIKEENARFVLQNRIDDGNQSVDFNTWMLGEEFYVNCSRRRFKWDGYLAVQKKPKLIEYITAVVPFQKDHNDVDTWLLFRLMPVQNRKAVSSISSPHKQLSES